MDNGWFNYSSLRTVLFRKAFIQKTMTCTLTGYRDTSPRRDDLILTSDRPAIVTAERWQIISHTFRVWNLFSKSLWRSYDLDVKVKDNSNFKKRFKHLKAKVNVQYAQRLSSHPTENTGTLGECTIGQKPVFFVRTARNIPKKYEFLVLNTDSTYINH